MKENISYILLLFIVFFLLAAIIEVKLGLVAIFFVVLWLVIINHWQFDPIENYLQLATIAGTYAALMAAILASWTGKVKILDWTQLSINAKSSLILDVLVLSIMLCIGIMVVTLFKLAQEKDHPNFAKGRRKRFVDRDPAGKKN